MPDGAGAVRARPRGRERELGVKEGGADSSTWDLLRQLWGGAGELPIASWTSSGGGILNVEVEGIRLGTWKTTFSPIVSDPQGTLMRKGTSWKTRPDTFGSGVSGTTGDVAWAGMEVLSTSPYQLAQARLYDGETGRFTSADPIGLAGGAHRFAYAGNNPATFVDPTGLYAQSSTSTFRAPAEIPDLGGGFEVWTSRGARGAPWLATGSQGCGGITAVCGRSSSSGGGAKKAEKDRKYAQKELDVQFNDDAKLWDSDPSLDDPDWLAKHAGDLTGGGKGGDGDEAQSDPGGDGGGHGSGGGSGGDGTSGGYFVESYEDAEGGGIRITGTWVPDSGPAPRGDVSEASMGAAAGGVAAQEFTAWVMTRPKVTLVVSEGVLFAAGAFVGTAGSYLAYKELEPVITSNMHNGKLPTGTQTPLLGGILVDMLLTAVMAEDPGADDADGDLTVPTPVAPTPTVPESGAAPAAPPVAPDVGGGGCGLRGCGLRRRGGRINRVAEGRRAGAKDEQRLPKVVPPGV